MDYNKLLEQYLVGKKLRAPIQTESRDKRKLLSLWGEEAGFSSADIHANRAYRIYIEHDEKLTIQSVSIVIEGELISPCSGYFYEQLDQFDFNPILEWVSTFLVNDA